MKNQFLYYPRFQSTLGLELLQWKHQPKIIIISTKDKIPLKCGVIDGSMVNGLGQTVQIGFVLDRPPAYKVFAAYIVKHYTIKKVNKSVLNTVTLCLGNDNHGKIKIKGKTLTFTLQSAKI